MGRRGRGSHVGGGRSGRMRRGGSNLLCATLLIWGNQGSCRKPLRPEGVDGGVWLRFGDS